MKRTLTCLAAVAVLAAGTAAVAAPVAPGGQWVIQSTPNRAVPSNQLLGISCTSGTACTAVGSSGGVTASFAPAVQKITTLAERWDGTHWRIEPTPNPASASFSVLNGVTCSSRRACTAVGSAVERKVMGAHIACRAAGAYDLPCAVKTLVERY